MIGDDKRATDIASYLLSKNKSGEMHYKKLMGLMYLSEREYIKRHGGLMSNNNFEAKEHGPVLSEIYELMEGKRISSVKVWDDEKNGYISFDVWGSKINELDDDNYLSVKKILTVGDLSEFMLSQADFEILDEIWEEFGHLSEPKLREYIKETCTEWKSARKLNGRIDEGYENEESSSNLIKIDSVCKHMELPQDEIDGVKDYINEWRLDYKSI